MDYDLDNTDFHKIGAIYQHKPHLTQALRPFDIKMDLQRVAGFIKEHNIAFIVVTGVSGLIGGVLSYLSEKPLVVIRQFPSAHSTVMLEGGVNFEDINGGKYLFVDDLIDSGLTVINAWRVLKEADRRYDMGYIWTYRDMSGRVPLTPEGLILKGNSWEKSAACKLVKLEKQFQAEQVSTSSGGD